jgi:hypothetical protein
VNGRRSGLFLAALLFSAALYAQATESSLARLRADGKKVGWDGVELGMSVVQAERRVGVALALSATGRDSCGTHAVDVERGTLRLTLGFPGARPGAKLETLYVHFEGYQALAKRETLVAELKRIAPGVVYVAPKAFPDLTESEAADPTFALPGEGGYGVRLDPGRGLFLAPLDCIG